MELHLRPTAVEKELTVSAPSPPAPHEKKRHAIMHHVRKPYGIATVIVILFILAWAAWTISIK